MPPPNTPEDGVSSSTGPTPRRSPGRSPGRSPRHSPHHHSPGQSQQPPQAQEPQPESAPSQPSQPSAVRPPPSPIPHLPPLFPIQYDDLKYEDPIDDTLQCPICRSPFYKPVTTKNCGHTFCEGCFHQSIDIAPICPIDRQPLSSDPHELFNTRIVSDQLDRLKVECPSPGCTHVTTRGLVSAHYEKYCGYTLVRCPAATCGEAVARMDAIPGRRCLHRNIQCHYCHKAVLIADLERHYDVECNGHTAKCGQCNAIVIRHRMSDHVEKECPETQVACVWHTFGCTLFTKRRLVDQHETNGCIYKTIGELAQDRKDDRMIINDLKDRLSAAEMRLWRIERNRRDSTTSIPAGWGFPELDPNISRGAHARNGSVPFMAGGPDSSHQDSPDEYLLAQFERMDNKVEDLRKTVTEQDGRHSMMLLNEIMPVKEQLAEVRSNLGVLGMHTTWLMNAQRQRGHQQQQQQHAEQQAHHAQEQRRQEQQQQRGNGPAGMGVRASAPVSASNGWSRSDVYGPGRRMSEGRGENPPRL